MQFSQSLKALIVANRTCGILIVKLNLRLRPLVKLYYSLRWYQITSLFNTIACSNITKEDT